MKKKIISILLTVCLAAGSAAVPGETLTVAAETEGNVTGGDVNEGEENTQEWEYEELEDGTVAVSAYRGTATEVTIPAALGGKQVSAIGSSDWAIDGVFYEKAVTKVTIPDGVKTIGADTFCFCKALTQIDIPSSVTTIGESAFYGCESLANVTLPENLTSIGESAFRSCYDENETKGLTSITIPAKVTYIGEDAFSSNVKLTKIEVAEANTTYASVDGVLFNKAKTELLVYPDGNPASKYVVPDGVQKIAKNAIVTENISEVTLPSSLREIGESAFRGSSLKAVTLPAGLTTIGAQAFSYCELKQITIPAGVTNIGDEAFYGNTELAAIQVDAANTAYASVDGVLCNKAKTELLSYPAGRAGTSYTIPEGVSEIGRNAFSGTFLTSIIVPKHVTRLKAYSLYGVVEEVTIQNKQCVFDAGEDNEEPVLNSITKIRGYKDSTAQEYAKANGNAFEIIPEECTTHNYEESVIEPATCMEKGEKKYTCRNCGHSYTEEIPMAEHAYYGPVITPSTCTKKGEEKYTCTNCGNSYTKEIPLAEHTYETKQTPAAPGRNGNFAVKCSVCGKVSENYTISAPKSVTLSKSTLTYNGKAQTVTVTVKDSAGKIIPVSQYSVAFSNNKNVGEAAATITFKGDYTGSMKKTFTILPKGTSLSKVTAAKKGFTVKWKKQASQTSGYEIQYALKSNFKGAKTVSNIKSKVTSKKITKLKAKKKYYVRIRTYKTAKVGGKNKKLYSGWSKAKTVVTKK